MAAQVSLKELVGELQVLFEESYAYIHIDTGEIVSFTSETVSTLESDEDWHKLLPIEVDCLTKVEAVLKTDEYLKLPDKFEIHEYNIMCDFCYEYLDEKISNILSEKIHGSGAFRRFKDAIFHFEIQDEWYQFLDNAYKEIAIDWLEENGFTFVDDLHQ